MMTLALALSGQPPAATTTSSPIQCDKGRCKLEVSPEGLLAIADRLVSAGRFDEARPYLEALTPVSGLAMERQFLEGYIAAESDDLPLAAKKFRAVLAIRPEMTRARLELARVLMLQGKDRAAEYHFRLAEEDNSLTPDIRRTVYAARSVIRNRERWSLSLGFGLAPDTNINSATSDRTVDVLFGDVSLPLELSPEARKNTGIGQTLAITAQGRAPLGSRLALAARLDGYGVNYQKSFADDVAVLLAAGPEFSPNDRLRFTAEALAARRWYGGRLATRQSGLRLSVEKRLSRGGGLGLELEARHGISEINSGFDGWTYSGRATYEHVIGRSLFASGSIFARRDSLASEVYSQTEFGAMAGIGGEMPHGLNMGFSTQFSRARYDDPIRLLDPAARRDWRMSARLYVASRRLRIGDFTPSISYTYSRNASNVDLFDFNRQRLEVQVTRLF
jgi:tetratricopeptide (TPR) repeat protein